ncbi:MAG: hypothetical protein ACOYEC_00880 [Christensenellales bacterium]|nr:hypothetical protein [Clostridiales bacterium]
MSELFLGEGESKPKKHKKSAGQIISRITQVLIALAIVGVMMYMLLTGARPNMESDSFAIKTGNFGVNPVWMPYGKTDDVNAIYDNIPQTGKTQAAYDIYILACQRLSLSKQYAARAIGNLEMVIEGGSASVVTNREEHYYIPGEPTLDANQFRIYSTLDITYGKEVKGDSFIAGLMQASAVMGVRNYCDGYKVYEQRSSRLYKNENNVYKAEWKKKITELPLNFERGYNDGELREKTNFIVNMDTILPSTVEINRVKEGGVWKYDVSFQLDCSTTDEGSATYYEAEAIKRKMGNAESFTYNYLKVNFTVYENGYFTYWATHQKYSLAYAVIKGYLAIDIAAEMDSRSYLSYDSNECKVDNFIDN